MISLVQLLSKLSESIDILEKFRVEEIREKNNVWVKRKFFSVFAAFMAAVIVRTLFETK